MKIENKILLSRLMTRSGDQAWDFVIPIVLIDRFPNNPVFAFGYFFSLKLGSVILMPFVGRLIDQKPRITTLKLGIGIQALAVLVSVLCIHSMVNSFYNVTYGLLILSGISSAIGTSIMDIAVANDLVPTVIPEEALPKFNSQMRQLDLATEVLSPVIAGSLILLSSNNFQLIGFSLIALWNLISFYPEYFLLNSVLEMNPALSKKSNVSINTKLSLFKKITQGWTDFKNLRVSIVIFAYSLLWLSVLSPHGVLLTAFLKGGWNLSEPLIGIFRGLGAFFGLLATILYPYVRKRMSLAKTSKTFLIFQASLVSLGLIFFTEGSNTSQFLFLVSVLLSRIGLYGFGLGEVELRQCLIPEKLRGEMNGLSTSFNSMATLLIFGMGLIFSTPESFKYLVWISTLAVLLSAIYFSVFFNETADKR